MTDIPVRLSTLIDYVDDAQGEPLDKLEAAYRLADTLGEQADHLIGHFVDQARHAGASWTQIGDRMGGVSKQAARKRFTPTDGTEYGEALEKAFGRYTPRAKQAVVAAQVTAREHSHDYIGTEHVLLGVLAQREAIAWHAVVACDPDAEALPTVLAERLQPASAKIPERMPFTGKAKKALELTLREALRLGHNYVGTEHLLLGLRAEDTGLAAEALRDHGLSVERLEPEILRLIEEAVRAAST